MLRAVRQSYMGQIITEQQLKLLYLLLSEIVQRGFGEITIRVWGGRLDTIVSSHSIKLTDPTQVDKEIDGRVE